MGSKLPIADNDSPLDAKAQRIQAIYPGSSKKLDIATTATTTAAFQIPVGTTVVELKSNTDAWFCLVATSTSYTLCKADTTTSFFVMSGVPEFYGVTSTGMHIAAISAASTGSLYITFGG